MNSDDRIRQLIDRAFVAAFCLMILMFAVIIGFVVWKIRAETRSEENWAVFKAGHACRIVSEFGKKPPIEVGFFLTLGAIEGTLPKTGWRCDDGVTYYK